MPNEPDPSSPAAAKAKGKPKGKPLLTVGWREWLELPDLGIPAFKAKVDTGARTSALHAVNVKVVEDKVKFRVQAIKGHEEHIRLELPLEDMRRVRSSNGKSELRPVVRTTLLLGGQHWPIDITLTRRDSMEFRMLLGREALRKHALVDVGRSYVLGIPDSLATADTLKKSQVRKAAPDMVATSTNAAPTEDT